MKMKWLNEARHSGARLAPACHIIGLDPRTAQRWLKRECDGDRRQGPKTRAHNKLTTLERKVVLKIASSPQYRDLSPKQIVPKLADSGRYIASESIFYRILREEKLLIHRGRMKAPASKKPKEYAATEPNQEFSWDITYLRSPIKGAFQISKSTSSLSLRRRLESKGCRMAS